MDKSNQEIRIVLADEHTAIRKSWRRILEAHPRFTILDDCTDGLAAQQVINKLKTDILLLDLTKSPTNGLIIAEKIILQFPNVKIIGISVSNRPQYASKMMSIGAKGYITKTSPLSEIYEGIIRVFNGQTYICEEIRSQLM